MKPKHLTILFAVLAGALLPAAAHAQYSTCYEFACDSYAVYDPGSNEISGYSRTVDYWWEGWYLFAESMLGDPNGETVDDVYAGGYSEAEADVSYVPGPSGVYGVHGIHSYGLEDNIAYDGDSYYGDVWVAPPPVVSSPTGQLTWYSLDPSNPHSIEIIGTGFTDLPWISGCDGGIDQASWAVNSSTDITGSLHVSTSLSSACTVDVWVAADLAFTIALEPAAPPPPPPSSVIIQVEEAKQGTGNSAFVLTGNDQSTTNLTGTGSPGGGTYQWAVGPGLAFQGPSTGRNVTIIGTSASTSTGDTWVSAAYTANGSVANASIRATVRVPSVMYAINYPGGAGSTTAVSGAYSGYLTNITYYIRDQGDLNNQTIAVAGINVIEVLQTVSNPFGASFDPPDNTSRSDATNSDGQVWDLLSVTALGGLPSQFSASRTQNLTLSGYSLSPQNTQTYGPAYATISTQTFSH